MKKILIRVLVLTVVFVAAVFGASRFLNREKGNTAETLASASFPLVYINMDGTHVNCLHGYAKEMDVMAMRDTLTPIKDDRTVSIDIEPFQNQIKGVSFEILSADGKNSVENTKVLQLEQKDDYVAAVLEIQNKLLMNTEYIMKIQVTVATRDIYFYTRILHQEGLNTDEYVNFVMGFYEGCLNKSDDEGLISQTIEPNESGDNTTLAHMDIHCIADQLMWASLRPQAYLKPIPSIKELNENTATFGMDYVLTAPGEQEGDVEMYHVAEYYRMRFNQGRVMLLDFERDTNQIFDPEDSVLVQDGIRLGICGKDVTYKNDPDQNFFGFVQEGALWLYQASGSRLTRVFSFADEEALDARTIYGENDIKIINIDARGNMYFLVCGYMNRGSHEGECGVALYYFDAAAGSIRECLYVETQEAVGLLAQDVGTLAYMTEDGTHFYMMLEGTLYGIDMESGKAEAVLQNLSMGCYAGASTGRMFAWLKQNERYDSTTLVLKNLETQKDMEFTCRKKERIMPIGFIDEDLIYGVASVSDIDTEYAGSEEFPMHKLWIVNPEGETVKEYEPSGCYVTGGTIDGKMLTLDRVKKTESGFAETTQDHIVNSSADEEALYGLEFQNTEQKQTEIILKVGTAIKEGTVPQILYARQVADAGTPRIAIGTKERNEQLYYVYAKGRLDSVFAAVNQAVCYANEQLGVVVNSRQQLVWERGNKKEEYTLDVNSIPDPILNGEMDVNKLKDSLRQEVLDLRGCEMDSVLYYVSEGTPVLAKTREGAVIIVGYDLYNTILLNPGEVETYYCGLEDSKKMFEEAGIVFVTYFEPPEE